VARQVGGVAAAERRAAEIVREAEVEAFQILEQAATVAFKDKGGRRRAGGRSAGRLAGLGTKVLALGSFALAVAAVVEISMGRV
jgi:hypothetical protein